MKRVLFYLCGRLIMIAAVPLAMSILLNLRAFSSSFMPTHDTFECFSSFAIFAKHLREFGEIPLWLPNSAWGTTSDWRQQLCISPLNWLFIWIAVIFRHADLLFLFKLSLILEQALFGASCAWLASLLFRRVTVQIFFVIAAMMASGLWHQHYCNLRMVTPIPWIVGLMLLAFRRKSRILLLASAWPIPAASYGFFFYFQAYYAILWLAAISLSLILYRKSGFAWLIAWPSRSQLIRESLVFILLVIFTGAAGSLLLLIGQGQTAISPGRDPTTGLITRVTYLSWAGVTDPATLVWSASIAYPDFAHNGEVYIYCGVLVVALALIGAFATRSQSSGLIKGLLFFTASFSVAGFLALLLYQMPLMDNFRHIPYTSVVARFFLCLAAGFGMQTLLDFVSRKNLISRYFIVRIPFLIALSFVFFLPIPDIWKVTAAQNGKLVIYSGHKFIIFSLVVGLISSTAIWATAWWFHGKTASYVISGIMLVTLIITACGLTINIAKRDTWILSDPFATDIRNVINAPLAYVPIRNTIDSNVLEFVADLLKQGAIYSSLGSMLNYDAPILLGHSDVVPDRTFSLMKLSQASQEMYRAFAMDGLPKAFLADHPMWVVTESVQPKPGDIYVETDQGYIILKRNQSPNTTVNEFSFNHVTFHFPALADGTGRRFLVYQDAWHPEWTATAGGKSVNIWPANDAFKAVEIPPGVSQITLRFGSTQRRVLVWVNALNALALLPIELMALLFLNRHPWRKTLDDYESFFNSPRMRSFTGLRWAEVTAPGSGRVRSRKNES